MRGDIILNRDEAAPVPASRTSLPCYGVRVCDVVAGPSLCALRVWTEEEWAALPPVDSPRFHEYCPGLGWVGAVPVAGLN